MAEQDEISDEAFGQLRLKRKAGGTGYMFVTGPKPKCKKNPYQARIMNNRIGKTQSLGSFPTAHASAVTHSGYSEIPNFLNLGRLRCSLSPDELFSGAKEGVRWAPRWKAHRRGPPDAQDAALGRAPGGQWTCCRTGRREERARGLRHARSSS